MKELITLDEMLDEIKKQNETSKLVIDSTNETIQIIQKIINVREKKGITQRDLAKKCGLKQPALARIESFKVIPKVNTLIKIANALNVKIVAYDETEASFVSQSIVTTYNNLIDNKGGYKWQQPCMV